ncbi:MAG: hypothetical protein KDD48_01995 [Bdellovibrionales bacterium]|nr:hypothetical protein [Bdellovibrionales bacterium]
MKISKITLTSFSVFFVLIALKSSPLWGSTERDIKNLGEFFQVFLIKNERRNPDDDVKFKRNSDGTYIAEISYWNNIQSRGASDEICEAFRWMLFGRGTYGKGAKEAFDRIPQLAQINLLFYDMDFGTRVGSKRTEILPTQKANPYVRVGLIRSSFQRKKINESSVKKQLDRGKCQEVGREYFDLVWINENHVRRGN